LNRYAKGRNVGEHVAGERLCKNKKSITPHNRTGTARGDENVPGKRTRTMRHGQADAIRLVARGAQKTCHNPEVEGTIEGIEV